MFLSNLSLKQKKIFLGVAKEILVVDDATIDSKEENYLRSICQEMSIGVGDELNVDNSELKGIFTSHEESRLILVELIALAYSNGKYHENQKKYIMEKSKCLGLKKNILDEIEKLVKQYFDIQKKIIGFIAPEEA
ncbi:MAG: hypothetical protein ACR2PY_07905 [Salinispira sp.]